MKHLPSSVAPASGCRLGGLEPPGPEAMAPPVAALITLTVKHSLQNHSGFKFYLIIILNRLFLFPETLWSFFLLNAAYDCLRLHWVHSSFAELYVFGNFLATINTRLLFRKLKY